MSDPALTGRLPVILSALVYPGAGQYYQKRWLAGTLYALLFTLAAGLLVYHVFKPMLHNLQAVMSWSADQLDAPLESIRLGWVLGSFALLLLVYLGNLLDVLHARRGLAASPHGPRTDKIFDPPHR